MDLLPILRLCPASPVQCLPLRWTLRSLFRRKKTEEEGKCLTKGKDNLLCNQGASSLLRPLLNIIDCPGKARLRCTNAREQLNFVSSNIFAQPFSTVVFAVKLTVAVGLNYFQTVDWSHWDSHKPRVETINMSSVLILPSELLFCGVRSQLEWWWSWGPHLHPDHRWGSKPTACQCHSSIKQLITEL